MSMPPFAPGGLDAERVRQVTEQVAAMATRARDAGAQLNRIAVQASSRNRAVSVVVGSGGILKSVQSGPAGSGMSAAQLCAAVMEAYGQASREAAAEASALMEQLTGRDTVAMQMMRAAMPAEEEQPT
ncbi:MAG: YbaB/EbfC family nucleoid-associated protein [Jatrophihabitantaceae bacterium]